MKLSALFGLCVYIPLVACAAACTPAEQQTIAKDEGIVVADTNSVCSKIEPIATLALPDAGAYVAFLCTGAELAEEAGIAVTQAVIRVEASRAAAFAAKHAPKGDGGPG